MLFRSMRDYVNAMRYFKRVEQLQPGNKNVLINIGITYKSMGDDSGANLYFTKAGNIK